MQHEQTTPHFFLATEIVTIRMGLQWSTGAMAPVQSGHPCPGGRYDDLRDPEDHYYPYFRNKEKDKGAAKIAMNRTGEAKSKSG